jgi:arylsulfatase A-like enzyme
MRELRDAYDTSIRYLDHSLGELLRALEARGVLDNTIVIVTSDHGELFGEHGLLVTGHAHSLYVQEVQVPLVVVYPPGVAAGVRRRETVSIRDVPATVMHLVAGDATPFPGQSLASIAGGPVDSLAARMQVGEKHRWANDNPQWPTSAGDMFAIVRGDMHYILNAGGREELYDLARDPQEQHDLATDTSRQAVLAGMRATLDTLAPARDGARSARVRR